MRRVPERPDLMLYPRALPLFAQNLGVTFAPLVAVVIALLLEYAQRPLFDPMGGAGDPIISLIVQLIEGFAFGVAVIFADDAWRHGRGDIRTSWNSARTRAGNILLASLGFYFLIWVAGLIGGLVPVPYFAMALQAAAVWAFIYAIPAAAIGGIPGGATFSASLQTAKRHPLATVVLVIVSLVVFVGLTGYALSALTAVLGYAAFAVARLLLTAIALGYIALVVAKQYADFAFRPYW